MVRMRITNEMMKRFKEIMWEHQERIIWIGQPIDTNPDWEKNFNEEMRRFNVELSKFFREYKREMEEECEN